MNFLLIGKPNVGKSSIYNILTSGKKNIIHKNEGTTRDWHKSNVKGFNNIIIYDTPGVIIKKNKINKVQFSELFNNIDKFIYVIDFKTQNYEHEFEFINELRKFNKEIILVINKDDNLEKNIYFKKFRLNKFFYISCSHNLGFDNLFEYFEQNDNFFQNNIANSFSIAIFGKPNSGKSTLANSLLGFKRIKTSNEAGTTSDLVEDNYIFRKHNFKILDTAGIFKKNKIDNDSINYEAIRKSLDIINKIDLSIMLIDSNDSFDSQTKKILNLLIKKSKSILIIFNKMDTIKNKNIYIKEKKILIKNSYSQTKNISMIFLSAKNKENINKLKNTIFNKSKNILKKLSTSKLNACIKKSSEEKPHPLVKGKSVNFKYAVQISATPLTIKVFSNYPKYIKSNYKTYLINKIVKSFNIVDSNVRLIFTSSKNPFN